MRSHTVLLLIVLSILNSGVVIGQSLRVCYIPDKRSLNDDRGYTFDGVRMLKHSVPKLMNPTNFGINGIVKRSVSIVPLDAKPITVNTITKARCDAVFVGLFNFNEVMPIITSELTAIRRWSLLDRANLVVVTHGEAKQWGYNNPQSNSARNYPTDYGATTKVFDGPFGNVAFFNQGGGFYGSLSGGTPTPLAKDENGGVTVALDKTTGDIILGDIDILTDLGGLSEGGIIQNMNDILFANIWAYAIELVTPEISDVQEAPEDQPVNKPTSVPASPSITINGQILKKGQNVILSDIQFLQSKSDLLPEGKIALNQVVRLLQQNPSLIIELSGHTSNEGDENENKKLSNQRVAVCKEYILGQITDADSRIKTIGYGSSRPKVSNDTESNRRQNRRVELKVESL